MAGSTDSLISVDFAFVSYNLDGSLNASFGVGGKVDTNLLGNFEEALAMTLQPDGRFVAARGALSAT